MYQTLFKISDPFHGVPLFGFGIVLAVWACFSLGLIVWLYRRHGWNSETLGYLPVLLIVGVAIAFVIPLLTKTEHGLPIRGYGVMMLSGILAAVLMAAARARSARFHPEIVFSFAFWMILSGIFGARLFHVIQYWPNYRKETWIETLGSIANVPSGGLVVYGSFIGAALITPLFFRHHKLGRLSGLALADLVAPSMVLGLALGRIGCLLNGCCFGGLCEDPWAVTFPEYGNATVAKAHTLPYLRHMERGWMYGLYVDIDVNDHEERTVIVRRVAPDSDAARQGIVPGDRIQRIDGKAVEPNSAHVQKLFSDKLTTAFQHEPPGVVLELVTKSGEPSTKRLAWSPPKRSTRIHPTQIYSAISAALICLMLLAFHPFRRRDGEVVALLITIYPITRFLLEIIRTDEASKFSTGLSISQLVSLGLFAAAAGFWWYLSRQPKHNLWATGGSASSPKSTP